MDTVPPSGARFESQAEKQHGLAYEAGMLAEARAENAAGLTVDSTEVDAWIDSLGTGHDRPVPYPMR